MNNDINNLFYLCSLIESISRITCNTKSDLMDLLKKEELDKIYNLADVYHIDDIKKTSLDLIEKFNIQKGNYVRIYKNMPSVWDIGKVFQRLIVMLSKNETEYIDKLIEIFRSWIILKIDDYDSSLYYESPDYIFNCYLEGKTI